MNKVYSVNIGGVVFNIDDQAYDKLNIYLSSIKAHFSKTEGSSEIIGDIENRIAEMLKEKLQPGKEAIGIEDVDYIISVMGRPEDFEDGEEQTANASADPNTARGYEEAYYTGKRKLFRDPDRKILGGVCSGIAAYFNVDDPLWIRLACVAAVFASFGSIPVVYVILWAIIPKARTLTDRMEMRGQNVTINNIKKNITEEYDDLKGHFQNLRNGRQPNRFADFLENLFHIVGTVALKIIAWVFIVFGICFLVALITGTLGFTPFFNEFPHFIFPPGSYELAITGILLLLGIPALALIIKSIQWIFHITFRSRPLNMILFFFWMAGLGITLYVAFHVGSQFSSWAETGHDYTLSPIHSDTMTVDINPKVKSGYVHTQFGMVHDDADLLLSNNEKFLTRHVSLKIERSEDSIFHLQESFASQGNSYYNAKTNAENTEYNYSLNGNKLVLDEYCSFPKNNAWRNQRVELTLQVPLGKTIYLAGDMHHFLNNIPNVTNTYDEDMLGHYWKMTPDGLKSPDFTKRNNEHIHRGRHHIRINRHNVDIDEDSDSDNSNKKI